MLCITNKIDSISFLLKGLGRDSALPKMKRCMFAFIVIIFYPLTGCVKFIPYRNKIAQNKYSGNFLLEEKCKKEMGK